MKKIKLENIIDEGFDRQTGKTVSKATTEYACQNCRYLVQIEDIYCWQCGERLAGEFIEHYYKGEKITDKEYQERKKLCH